MRGLGHLLELISNWFNITLGEKLIEHLKKWLEPEKLVGAAAGANAIKWRPGEESKVAAATLELFHKLPEAAVKFLETQGSRPGLVVLVMQLEAALPIVGRFSELTSPYTVPLARFLSRYAAPSARYFIARLDQEEYSKRLISVITIPEGEKLRDEMAANATNIVQASFGSGTRPEGTAEPPYAAQFAGVRLIRTNLSEKDVQPVKEQLTQSLFDHIPVGVGSKGAYNPLLIVSFTNSYLGDFSRNYSHECQRSGRGA